MNLTVLTSGNKMQTNNSFIAKTLAHNNHSIIFQLRCNAAICLHTRQREVTKQFILNVCYVLLVFMLCAVLCACFVKTPVYLKTYDKGSSFSI